MICLDSGQPGPQVGISAMTHGNEPVGLKAFQHLLESGLLSAGHLQAGKVLLFVMNLKAAEQYFSSPENTFACRCADQDMNRLPSDLEASTHYEARRVSELQPLLAHLDLALDIHSTSQAAPPMVVEITPHDRFPQALFAHIPIVIRDLLPFLKGEALISYMGHAETERYVVECGQHEAESSVACATEAILSLLRHSGVMPPEPEPLVSPASQREIYQIYQGVSFPDASYAFERLIQNFEFLPQDFVFAQGGQGALSVPKDSYAIMPPAELKPTYYQTDFMYFAERL